MRMKKITLAVLMTVLLSCQIFAAAVSGTFEDLLNFVPNTITSVLEDSNFGAAVQQLQTLYMQYEKAVQQYQQLITQYNYLKAKGQQWANISSLQDGLNLLEKEMKTIKDVSGMFTDRRYSYGGMKFSLEDLFQRKNDSVELKDLMSLIAQNARDKMKDSVDSIVEKMSAEQKMKILRDYGMSPDSYIYYMATMNEADKIRQYIFGSADEKMWETIRSGNLEQAAKILEAAKMESGKEDPSDTALLQQIVAMTHEVVRGLNTLNESTMRLGIATAYQVEIEEQEKRDKARQENYQRARASTGGGQIDANF